MAISEAVEVAGGDPDASYALGSVLNHVALHQSVIGQEALKQLAKFGERCPRLPVRLCGRRLEPGRDQLPVPAGEPRGPGMNVDVVACEPAAAPSLTEGEYRYDFGDSSSMTPLLKMYTLGADFVPDPVHAGGLRYHGMAPLVSPRLPRGTAAGDRHQAAGGVRRRRRVRPRRGHRARLGVQPRHRGCAAAGPQAAEDGTSPVILIGVSGSGQLDLPAYSEYLAGTMLDACTARCGRWPRRAGRRPSPRP
jgi:tryptophan synthase beta chain